MKQSIVVEQMFAAAHFIEKHPKCGKLHGHNWRVRLTLEGYVEDNGMIVDFGEVKRWVDVTFDHMFIAPQTHILEDLSGDFVISTEMFSLNIKPEAVCIIPEEYCPVTAENLTRFIRDAVNNIFDVKITKVELWETNNNLAILEGEE